MVARKALGRRGWRALAVRVSRHGAFALALGAVSALAAAVLTAAIGFVSALSKRYDWLLFALPIFGVVSIGLFRLLGLPLDAQPGSVVDEVRDDERVPAVLAPAALVATCLTVLGGGSAGMTATALAIGASTGSGLGRIARLAPRSPRAPAPATHAAASQRGWTAACGMAAAFSALYAAPLAGAAFALELVRFDREVVRHMPALVLAALAAALIAQPFHAGYSIPGAALPAPSWNAAALCVFVGLACAVAGFLFAGALNGLRRVFRRARVHPALATVAGGALAAAAVLAFQGQRFEGSGLDLVEAALAGQAGAFDFAAKALITVLVLGFGFKGGEVMPAFATGSMLGVSCAGLVGGDAPFAAAMGLVAFFAAAARCPAAAVLFAAEVFGWAALPWAALTVVPAYLGSADVGTHGRGAASFLAHRRAVRADRRRNLRR